MKPTHWLPIGLGALALAAWLSKSNAPPDPTEAKPSTHSATAPQAFAPVAGAPTVAPQEDTPTATPQTPHAHAAYESGQRLVRVTDPMELPDLIAAHDVTLTQPIGRSGFAVVSGDPANLEQLMDDPRVASSSPLGIIEGASRHRHAPTLQAQWHLDMVAPAPISNAGSWTVAVLDSGVAYETARRSGTQYTRAPSLASSPIRNPYDFVNRDGYANDDCGHGTHIASVIAGNSFIQGVTPGTGLMPLKVLDGANRGTEYGLIEAIYHAAAHEADVINMSLSFRPGYVPSGALKSAIQYAEDRGVVMVGAAGNHGVNEVSWPAASPHVIAVGGSQLYPDSYYGWYGGYMTRIMEYSNKSGAVDVVAPGGNLASDQNGDGYPDGILAEAIDPTNPANVGYWLMAGTSQGAAITSGLVVQLLDAGVHPDDVGPALQRDGLWPNYSYGKGGGYTYMYGEVPWSWPQSREIHATVLPFLSDYGSTIRPAARISLFDGYGNRAESGLSAIVNIVGEGGGTYTCVTDSQGSCTVSGSSVWEGTAAAWKITLVGIEDRSYTIHRPIATVTTTPELQAFVTAVEHNGYLREAMLAWSWQNTWDSDLGSVSEGLSLVDVGGSGLASLPLGVVLTQPAVNLLGQPRARTVRVNGEPVQLSLLELDGNGLMSIPLGLRKFPILAIDGSGFASLPLGLKATDMLGLGDTMIPMVGHGLASLPYGVKNSPVGTKLRDGGWTVQGFGAASALGSSTALPIQYEYEPAYFGAALGAVPY